MERTALNRAGPASEETAPPDEDLAVLCERLRKSSPVLVRNLTSPTLAGKGPAAVAALAREAEVPCVALVGEAVEKPDEFDEVRSLAEHFGSIEEAKTRAAPGLQALAARVASDWR